MSWSERKEKAVADVLACLNGLTYEQADAVLSAAKKEIGFKSIVRGGQEDGSKSGGEL